MNLPLKPASCAEQIAAVPERITARIVLTPGRLGGQATVGESRIGAELVAGVYWQHGMAEAETQWEPFVDYYGVLIACWYMARYGSRTWRKRWAEWLSPDDLAGADNVLWRSDRASWDSCPLPPTRHGAVS